METEELATNCREGKIDKPKKKQAGSRRETDEQNDREKHAERALILERAIARAEPTKGWK